MMKDFELGRANPLLTYLVGILLGWSVATSDLSEDTGALILNASFAVVVFALVTLGEISYRAGD